jgi:hypothetical protein
MNKKIARKALKPLDWVGKYFAGRAQATKDGKWFHVDKNEKPIYKERWDWVSPAHKEFALARKNNRYFTIRLTAKSQTRRP